MGTGETDRHQVGLGARRRETHPFGRRHQTFHQLAPTQLQFMTGGRMSAAGDLAFYSSLSGWMRMTDQKRAMAAKIIDVFITVDVPLA